MRGHSVLSLLPLKQDVGESDSVIRIVQIIKVPLLVGVLHQLKQYEITNADALLSAGLFYLLEL